MKPSSLFNFRKPFIVTVAASVAMLTLSACSTTRVNSTLAGEVSSHLPAQYSQGKLAAPPSQAKPLNKHGDSRALWWDLFGDPAMNAFVTQALQNNQDLLIATARIEQARAIQVRSDKANLPAIDLGSSATRLRASLNDSQTQSRLNQPGFERTSNTFRVDGTLNWELDFFGRKDAIHNAEQSRLKAAQAYEQDIKLIVVTDVAKNVIKARALQSRIKLAQASSAADSETFALTRAKLRGGQISSTELLRVAALVTDSQTVVARLQHNYAETIKTLAILLASTPEEVRSQLELSSPQATNYKDLILSVGNKGLPSDLLKRRPDIKRAEFQLGAASMDLAATNAERFPTFNIGSSLALLAGTLSKLTALDSILATFVPSISWKALDFGRLDADIARAIGVEKEALNMFKKSVTIAFAEADTALDNVVRYQSILELSQASKAAQNELWEISLLHYERGLTDMASSLDNKRSVLRAEDASALALQDLLEALVTTYRALGGEWGSASLISTSSD